MKHLSSLALLPLALVSALPAHAEPAAPLPAPSATSDADDPKNASVSDGPGSAPVPGAGSGVSPEPSVPLGITAAAAQPADADAVVEELFAARPDEPQLFPKLRGVRFIAEPSQLTAPGFPADGVDASLQPALEPAEAAIAARPFMDKPASEASLQRMVDVVRGGLRASGRPFTTVYLPPQDVTDGHVQIVVSESRSEGEIAINGARYFSPASYRSVFRQAPGAPIDAAQAHEDIAWLNRNPFRRADLSAEPGREPGTTRLALAAQERLPLTLTAGYSNTGTRATGEDRVSANLQWGNALGRGDLFNFGFSGDPDWRHMRGGNASYTAFLPWRHILTLFGAYSEVESIMPPPFTQGGRSWQLGARYEIPLPNLSAGWTQGVSFSADFKYSDNTLEFAAIPITDNITHIVQFGATYTLGGRVGPHGFDFSLDGTASPGGLTKYNDDDAFAGSRPGATADYYYARLGVRYSLALPADFSWQTRASFQLSEGRLLGSEQIGGGGSSAVRGYRESSAFGDTGLLVNNELHLPPLRLARLRTAADVFLFADFASLNDHGGGSAEPRSAGVGANLQILSRLSVSFAYGWQLKDLGDATNSRGHLSATLSW